jgi:hypothetical protein
MMGWDAPPFTVFDTSITLRYYKLFLILSQYSRIQEPDTDQGTNPGVQQATQCAGLQV